MIEVKERAMLHATDIWRLIVTGKHAKFKNVKKLTYTYEGGRDYMIRVELENGETYATFYNPDVESKCVYRLNSVINPQGFERKRKKLQQIKMKL